MKDERSRTGGDAAPADRHGRDLKKVNAKLRELITSLRSENERRSSELRPPEPAAAERPEDGGDAVDLEKRKLVAELVAAREAVARAERERGELRDRLAEIEEENRRICDEYVAVQEQTSQLAQLYVALERLHGGLSRPETLAAIQEIVINVVGSEELAVFERRGDAISLVQSFGVDPEPLRRLEVGAGAIGGAIASGELYVAGRKGAPAPGDEDVTAVVPLRAGGEVVGALAVFRLLGHKPGLDDADQAMFDLLAAHAGVALRLRGERSFPG